VINRTTKKTAWTMAALGYLTAAFYYWPFGGIPDVLLSSSRYICPLCPNVDSLEPPTIHFIRGTAIIGTVNAVALIVIGATALFLFRAVTSRMNRRAAS